MYGSFKPTRGSAERVDILHSVRIRAASNPRGVRLKVVRDYGVAYDYKLQTHEGFG